MTGEINVLCLESLKHQFCSLFSVFWRVFWRFGEQNALGFIWTASEFVIKGMVLDLFHTVPVLNNTLLDRVSDVEDTSEVESFFGLVILFSAASSKDSKLFAWFTSHGGENSRRNTVIVRESCLN